VERKEKSRVCKFKEEEEEELFIHLPAKFVAPFPRYIQFFFFFTRPFCSKMRLE
jgi:hypothetical protein